MVAAVLAGRAAAGHALRWYRPPGPPEVCSLKAERLRATGWPGPYATPARFWTGHDGATDTDPESNPLPSPGNRAMITIYSWSPSPLDF